MKQSIDVLIINSLLFREGTMATSEDFLLPLGLGYIATDLMGKGIMVELLDAVVLNISLDNILETIREKEPAYVAINVFTTNLHLVQEIVESTNGVRFIIGGLSTKTLWPIILNWETSCPIDIVIGEGDFVTSAIIQKKPLNIMQERENKRVILVSKDSPYFPQDISDIPLDRNFFVHQPLRHPLGFNEVSIVTSRGCMYNCAFCSAARSLNQEIPIRQRSTTSVANEVKTLCEIYPDVNTIRVLDDLFLRNAESVSRATEIFRTVPVTWRAMAHVKSLCKLDNSQLSELKHSGCAELFIGIESGSPRILDKIHKTSNIDIIKQTIERLFVIGIAVKGYFIFGFDAETAEEMKMLTFNPKSSFKSLLKSLLQSKVNVSAKSSKYINSSHSRYIIVDNKDYYHLGASINAVDAENMKSFSIQKIADGDVINSLNKNFSDWWDSGSDIS